MIAERVLEPVQRELQARHNDVLNWYAVIDSAQPLRAIERSRIAHLHSESLYDGKLAPLAHTAAPYLVSLNLQDDYTAWLLAHASQHWGILLQSSANFGTIRQHLRRFLLVEDPNGKRFRFRFYDPRILRAFLPVCTVEEAAHFFGPVQRFYASARNPRDWNVFMATSRGVHQEVLPTTS